MQKIFNWTVGSFFRSIGRIIAYIVVGSLIAYILSSNDFRITDLFFENVSAAELVESVKYAATDFITSNSNYASTDSGYIIPVSSATGIQRYQINFSPLINTSNYDYIQFQVLVSQPNAVTYSYQNELDQCERWTWGAIDSYNNVSRWDCARVTSYPQNFKYVKQTEITNYNFNMFVNYSDANGNNAGWAMCSQQDNQFFCPTNHKYINFVGFFVDYDTNINANVNFIFFRGVTYYNYDNSVSNAINNNTNAINNQTQQQQQQHNEVMDSNTTQAEDEAGDFLGNFTVEDTGGLNAIITAPLSTIQSLLNNTCTKLILPLPFVDKNIELPCLYPIYNEYFGAFFTIYQTIILGIISYRCIKSLFFDVKGFTNPEDDRIEVMDL